MCDNASKYRRSPFNTVPIFAGANFCTWQQQMGDFLHFQKLWRITSSVTTRPLGATPADLLAQPGIGSVYADLQAALHVKILGGQNPQVEMQWMLTLFERLCANRMMISNPIQGMMPLNTLPEKWDSIAMVYLQGQNVLANVTFAMVRDAIMAEYEQTSYWNIECIAM
jgi:hypothetical protein